MRSVHPLILLFCVFSIFVMGLIMIFNTTSAEVLDHALSRSTHQALYRQILYALMGLGMASLVWFVGYRRFLEWSPYLLAFFTFLLVLTLIPGVGREVNGSKRWIAFAGISLQPSEFVKYLAPAYFIHRILELNGQSLELRPFLKLIGLIAIPMFLILIEPNNGTAGVIGLTVLVACVITQVRFKYWGLPLAIMIVIGGISAYHLPYVTARIKVYMHPELDLKGKGHQPYQAKIAAGSGGLFGRGPGNSLQKLSYLPEAQNDYIAAIYAEEFGFVGMLVLISLYMIMGYVGFQIALFTPDPGGFYLATVITFLICFQSFMNLGVVSGLLPSTGLNLPFFSQGGTSLMVNVMGLGLLLNIARTEKLEYV
ncbi:MAG: putative lipid II flippase FtsW [Parachlamydiaceae bacterium]|nr:putative lipid II flippase FtsW [Parachlamydiaceae bacterium]